LVALALGSWKVTGEIGGDGTIPVEGGRVSALDAARDVVGSGLTVSHLLEVDFARGAVWELAVAFPFLALAGQAGKVADLVPGGLIVSGEIGGYGMIRVESMGDGHRSRMVAMSRRKGVEPWRVNRRKDEPLRVGRREKVRRRLGTVENRDGGGRTRVKDAGRR
jgi:hypothetical protein